MKRSSLLSIALCVVGSLSLSGCSANFAGPATTGATTPLGNIRGAVYGGQQPIVGAEVFLFAVGTSAYFGTSISLLKPAANTTFETGTGNYYVTTDTGGEFNISGDYTCTPGQVLYLYSINGNPTYPLGSNNSAASLMSTLGTCPSGGTFAGQIPYVYMNEVSTVATAFAFEAYETNSKNISIGPASSSGSGPSSLALTGLQNAAQNAAKLYNISGNIALFGANSVTPGGNGAVPQKLINAIANILASCINSGGPSSTQCTQLFNNLTPNSNVNSGVQVVETATAAMYIAKNPGTNVTNILAVEGTNPVFTPTLAANYPLNDFTIGITYTDSSLNGPNDIAIDASGDAWVTNPTSGKLTKFAPSGLATSVSVPSANFVTIDTSGNAWVTSASTTPSIYVYNNSLSSFSDYTTTYSLSSPQGLANDGTNTYVADKNNSSEYPYGPSGNANPTDSKGNTYITTPSLASVQYLAADTALVKSGGSGFIWGTSESGLVCQFGSYGGTQICAASSGLTKPERVAIDATHYAWVPDYTAGLLYQITGQRNNGALFDVSYVGGGLSGPIGVAVDGNATVWVANTLDGTNVNIGASGSGISAFSTSGTALTPNTGFWSGLSGAGHKNLAIDGSGDIWLANSSLNSITEVIGVAGALATPLSAGALAGTPAAKP